MRRVSKAKKYCGRWRWFNHQTGELTIWHCDTWDCPTCGTIKAKRVAIQIGKEARKHELKSFITITLPSWYRNKAFQTGDRALKKGFQNLVRQYREDFGKVAYIWVEERHRDGTPHLHIISDMVLSKHELHNRCVKAHLGYIADIRPILDDGGYFYVAKYLAKGEKQIPVNIRRVGSSRDIKLSEPHVTEDVWTLYVSNPLTSL